MAQPPTTGLALTVLPDVLRDIAARFPERVAVVVDGAGSMTFTEWEQRATRVARELVELGVNRDDRVALLLSEDDAIRGYVSYFGAQMAGGVPAPINARLAPREIAHVLELARPTVLVTSTSQRARAQRAVAGLDPPPLLVCPSADASDPLALQPHPAPSRSEDERGVVPPGPDASDLADMLFTSGTTGLPKGVASTHENLLGIDVAPSETESSMLHAAPLGTALGTYGTMLTCLRLALTNVCLPRFSTSRFAELIGDRRPGWLMVVPAHVQLLRESRALEAIDVSSVRVAISGTAPLPQASFAWLATAFPEAVVLNAYSLTEAGDAACLLSYTDSVQRPGSVGKPIAGGAVRVVDGDGHEVASGEIGELELRLRRGRRFYFADPTSTADTFSGGWVRSGDLGYLDRDGFVYLVDRKKDMIIRGGFNVYSVEVEGAVSEHPAVLEAAMVGVVHPVLGQDVAAVVRLRDGASLDLATLQAFLSERLADYKIPRTLLVTTEPLPRTAAGKLDRPALRAIAASNPDRVIPAP